MKKGEIYIDREDPTGKVSANIDMKKKSRQETVIKIVIVCAETEKTLFKAEYSTDKTAGISAYTIATNIINEYCNAHDLIPDISSTGGKLPIVRTVKRGRRW
ncbi:hypothetical protein ACLIBH_04915 [Virgibacillus sp. W0430]|uniref:hypothetical protein n=1 Tax=Virgibacillus sp. W0430 TaxID=3391580 RepID=UPI003F477FD9